jgi:O-antigen/teichoic acid export membrane protein
MINTIKIKYANLITDTRFSEILAGSVWALSARVIGTGLGLVSSVIVARIYGAEIIGIVAVINSFLMITTIFSVFGTNTSILRLIPEHLAKYSPSSAFQAYRKTHYMVLIVSIFTAAIFFFSADLIADKVFSKPHLSYYFALASIFIIFKSMMELNTQAIRGLRLIRLYALILLLPQIFNLLFLISGSLLWHIRDVPVYAMLFGFTVTAIIGLFVIKFVFEKKIKPEDTVCPMDRRTILSTSLPMFMSATMTFLIAQTGVLLLGMFQGEEQVGYYAIAVKIATLSTFILQAVNSMAGPKFSELFHSGKLDDLFHVAQKSAKLIFIVVTPIVFFFLILGKPILGIVFGDEFSTAYPPLVILLLGQFVHAISGLTGVFLNMTGHQKVLRNIMLIAAFINIGLNLWLIPILSINGAALSAAVSISFMNLAVLLFIKLKYGKTIGYIPILSKA